MTKKKNQLLREKNIKHFSQAKATPCVNGELQRILTEPGLAKHSNKRYKEKCHL
jgi:hypothetical protein